MNRILSWALGAILLAAGAGVAFLALEYVLDANEAEECMRLERQVELGYIKAEPEWCAAR